jgi:hypothetical protein
MRVEVQSSGVSGVAAGFGIHWQECRPEAGTATCNAGNGIWPEPEIHNLLRF